MAEAIKTAEKVETPETPEAKEGEEKVEAVAGETPAADAGAELEKAKEELKDPELSEKAKDKVQARIDQLVGQVATLKAQLEEQGKVAQEKLKKPEVTEEALIGLLKDAEHPEYHDYARVELAKLYARQEAQKVRQEIQAESFLQRQIDKAAEKYPDLLDENSELWKKANDLYLVENLKGSKNGVMMAVQLAAAELGLANEHDQTKTQLQKKLDKENAKKSLALGGKKVTISTTAVSDKLKKEALEAGPNSPKWFEWQKDIVRKARGKIV